MDQAVNIEAAGRPDTASDLPEPARGRSVLVAGGAGFLGSHLCARLVREGCRVVALDNLLTGRFGNVAGLAADGRLAFVRHDIVDPLPASLPRFDEIYNLACPASPPSYQRDPVATLRTCATGTYNLLLRAERDGARLFHASTSEVYGDPEVHPQPESYWGNVNPIGPRACYDEGKRFAETMTFDFARSRGVPVRVARIFNTYGPRMHPDDGRVVSNFIVQALRGEPITIHGSGDQTRSFCYVSDLIEGFLRLMRLPTTFPLWHPVNLGNPAEIRVGDLAERVIALTGSNSPIVTLPLPVDDPRRRRPDIEVAKRLLGWWPEVPLEQGLCRTIDHFASTLHAPAPVRAAAPRPAAPALLSVPL